MLVVVDSTIPSAIHMLADRTHGCQGVHNTRTYTLILVFSCRWRIWNTMEHSYSNFWNDLARLSFMPDCTKKLRIPGVHSDIKAEATIQGSSPLSFRACKKDTVRRTAQKHDNRLFDIESRPMSKFRENTAEPYWNRALAKATSQWDGGWEKEALRSSFKLQP